MYENQTNQMKNFKKIYIQDSHPNFLKKGI